MSNDIKIGKVQFHSWTCDVMVGNYVSDATPCIYLLDSETGEPICKATVNMSESHNIPAGYVAIKDYAENAGIYAVLANAGIIEKEPLSYILTPHVEIPITKLLL